MKCWEYKTISADCPDDLVPKLNKLGGIMERWKLVSIVVEMVEHEEHHVRYTLPRYVAMLEKEYDPYDDAYIP